MKNKLIVPFIVMTMMFGAVACTGPKRVYKSTSDVFTAVVETLNTYKKNNHINDEDWKEDVVPYVVEGNKILDLYRAALLTPDPTDEQGYMQKLVTVTDRLIAVRNNVEKGK